MVTYAVFNKGVVNIRSKNKMYFVWTMEEYVNQARFALLILSTAAEKMNKLFSNVAYRPRIDLVIDAHQQMWFQSKDNPWGSMLYV